MLKKTDKLNHLIRQEILRNTQSKSLHILHIFKNFGRYWLIHFHDGLFAKVTKECFYTKKGAEERLEEIKKNQK